MLNKSFVELLNFKHKSCIFNNSIEEDIPHNYVNLYVKIADRCNAGCEFCEYRNLSTCFKFNYGKFVEIINTLTFNSVRIQKVSFTGGEPTLNLQALHACLRFLKTLDYPPFTVVNSNGFGLAFLVADHNLDNISLSRHAILDSDHFNIMKTNSVPSTEELKRYYKGSKIHLTCNLIKGQVDSEESILDYLEYASRLGVYDVGFVSLMKINHFCEEHHIDFDDISFSTQQVVCNKEWSYKDVCKCKNFLYLPKKGNKVVKFYSRYRCKNKADSESNYVFDGEHLRSNFGGKIII